MVPSQFIKRIDVFEDGGDWTVFSPKKFGGQGFEEILGGSIVKAVFPVKHRGDYLFLN